MNRLTRDGGYLRAVAGATLYLAAAAAWPPEATAQASNSATERVSVASDGSQGNDDSEGYGSGGPAISTDGRFVAFASHASNLVDGDTNGDADIFVHDRQTRATERVSVGTDGSQGNNGSWWPAISGDGRFVTFMSHASNLVKDDTNNCGDVFVHDRQSGATERVSVATDGSQANEWSLKSAISSDGRFVAFESFASNLVPGDILVPLRDIFVHDRQTGTTERVSVNSSDIFFRVDYERPAISADGRFVAFDSNATLLYGDSYSSADVFVHDRLTGTTEGVGASSSGSVASADGHFGSGNAAISADGRFVAFASNLRTLIPGDARSGEEIFVHDRQTGTNERISDASDGGQANFGSYEPAISADGRFVAFWSQATNLVAGDTDDQPYNPKVFVHDRQTGTTVRVSISSDGTAANNTSENPAISADGRIVAFVSSASNLVVGDTNDALDVFVRFSGETASPLARAGGPYAFCANVDLPLILDGTSSLNPDEGLSEPGFPGDTIRAYEWDLDDDGTFDDAVGMQPDVTAFFETAPAGTHTVALKVTDTTATSFPSSGLADQSGVDRAEVVVYDEDGPSCACVANLSARVKSGKVQLSWTDLGAPGGYRVYRADLRGGQSHAVASVPPGYLYVDGNVNNGRSYRYKVVTIADNGAETCPSNAVIATPRGR